MPNEKLCLSRSFAFQTNIGKLASQQAKMKIIKIVALTILGLSILGLVSLFLIGYLKPKPGGIFVDTAPVSNVYINNILVGKTPFKGMYDSGEITVKLVPEANDQNLVPFETKITLVSGIQTVVRREFAKTEDQSSDDIISFNREDTQTTSLVVISTPENAEVSLDGVARGFAPYKTSTISPAEHTITVKAPGYSDRVMTVKTFVGYRLTVFAKLGKTNDQTQNTPVPSPTPTPSVKTYVQILDTPTGFLRIRTEPGTAGEEIAEVKPGSKYQYLETDSATGWYKIQYQDPTAGLPNGIVGWVSNQFTKKLDPSSSNTAI